MVKLSISLIIKQILCLVYIGLSPVIVCTIGYVYGESISLVI